MSGTQWLQLQGADNVRDVGGMPLTGGGQVRSGRLLRSDSLQALTESDVRLLVDEYRVRDVVDLRSGVEVRGEGPGPMTREPLVTVRHLSLFQETSARTLDDPDAPEVLPWQDGAREIAETERRWGARGHYLNYLENRPDSILTALRTIAHSPGATVVHCAAGKDRTGVVVALALRHVGAEPDAIVADYAISAGRVERVYARLATRRTYAAEIAGKADDLDRHKPRAETKAGFLELLDELHGGVGAWLHGHGWSEHDDAALRAKLVG